LVIIDISNGKTDKQIKGINMKYVIFQEQLKSEIHNDINSLGWDGAIKKHPDLKIIMDVQFDGTQQLNAEEFKKVFNEYYMASAEVECDCKEDVFHLSNIGDSRVTRLHEKCRSASVGDVIYDVENDQYHMIDTLVGFDKVSV
jgi:hypothetical protein